MNERPLAKNISNFTLYIIGYVHILSSYKLINFFLLSLYANLDCSTQVCYIIYLPKGKQSPAVALVVSNNQFYCVGSDTFWTVNT